MFAPLLLIAGIGAAWWAYKATNQSNHGRKLVTGYLTDELTSDEVITLGLESQGFSDIGPVMVEKTEWRVYAKPPATHPVLPLPLTYLGFPAFAITAIE